MEWKSEAEFQTHCYKWYDQSNPAPDQKARLMMIYNNPPHAAMGAILTSMGLKRGPSDFLFFVGYKRLAWIELKVGYNQQTKDQLAFQGMVESLGFEYYLVRSKIFGDISPFTNLILNLKV